MNPISIIMPIGVKRNPKVREISEYLPDLPISCNFLTLAAIFTMTKTSSTKLTKITNPRFPYSVSVLLVNPLINKIIITRTEIAFIPILQINEIYIHYYKT